MQMRRIDKRCGCGLFVSRVRSRISSRGDEFTAGTGRDEHEQIRLDSEELVHAACTRQSEFVSSFDSSARYYYYYYYRYHYYWFRRVERSPNFRIPPRPSQIPTLPSPPFVFRSIERPIYSPRDFKSTRSKIREIARKIDRLTFPRNFSVISFVRRSRYSSIFAFIFSKKKGGR